MNAPGSMEKIAENAWLKVIGRAGMALFVPAVIWAGATLTSVDRRLYAMEQQLAKAPRAYTSDEAVEFAKAIGARFDGDERWISNDDHRISALEDARRRP